MVVRRRLPPITAGLLGILGTPAAAVAAPETDEPSEVEALHLEGQRLYEAGDFLGAGTTWTQLLERLPESEANATARESVVLNILRAYTDAFERVRDEQGHRDIEHLRAAKRVAEGYVDQWTATHGEAAPIGATVKESIAELDRRIEDAERYPDSAIEPCLAPCLSDIPPPPARRGCGNDGEPELAMLGLLPLGLAGRRKRRRDSLARLAARLPPDVVARLHARGDIEDDDAS